MTRTRSLRLGALLISAVALALLTAFLLAETRITDGTLSAPLDDAWIHMQFARNIARGDGFSYNPGVPTPGSTAPLWTLLLALPALVTEDLMPWALAFSALFFMATVWLSYGFAYWLSRSVWTAVLAGLGVALAGRLLWAGLAGMETTAFAALSISAVWLFSRDGLQSTNALLFGLASQMRPEGHALFALAVGLQALAFLWPRWRSEGQAQPSLMAMVGAVGLYVLLSLPYSIFSLATTGKPLPNTFYAKAGQASLFSVRTLRETLAYAWGDNPVTLLLVLLGVVPTWRKSRLTVVWLLALPLFTAVVIDFTWHHGRYTMPLIPFQMIVGAMGAWWLVGWLSRRTQLSARMAWLGMMALIALGGLLGVPTWARMLGTNTQEILDIDVALGEWLRDNTPPDALIAVDDIGAITYLSEREIVDMNGLVSPEVWPSLDAAEGLPRDQVLTRILSQHQPDYMAAFPLWRWNIATNSAVARELHHVHTDTHTMIFQQDAYVYETDWPYVSEATPSQAIGAQFGEIIELVGTDISAETLTLFWRSLAPTDTNYDVFVHLLDENGNIVAQADRQPVGGLAATSVWQPGDLIRDEMAFAMPTDLPAGDYALRLGLFDRETGVRLAVADDSAENNAVLLETITISVP